MAFFAIVTYKPLEHGGLISSKRKSTPKGYNSKSLLQVQLSFSYSLENRS